MKLHTIVLFACVAGLWAVACRSFRAADLLPTKVGLGYSDSDGRFDADSHPEGSWGNQHTGTSGDFGGHSKSVGAEWEPFAGEHIAANEERRARAQREEAYAAFVASEGVGAVQSERPAAAAQTLAVETQGSGEAPRLAHNQEAAGSSPVPVASFGLTGEQWLGIAVAAQSIALLYLKRTALVGGAHWVAGLFKKGAGHAA